MKYGSVCSGIEAASVAWHNLGWEPQWFSEIEQFPSDVLKHRFPTVPNLGDMTTINQNPIADERPIDLLVGGTPCQSFSVAGLRKGLADPRGNLMLTFLSIADKLRPKWIVWENVPGVLSSNGGKDFGTFLGALGELGYGFAYRVLDAQHFGVAQRRRRVFVVGCLGDWRAAAAVLFERESLQGNPKPSRKKREEVTTDAQGSVGEASSWWDGSQVAGTLTKQNANGAQRMPDKDNFGAILQPTIIDRVAQPIPVLAGQHPNKEVGIDVCPTLPAAMGMGGGHTPLVPHPVAQPIAFQSVDYGGDATVEKSPTLRAHDPMAVAQPIGINGNIAGTIDANYFKGCGSANFGERDVVAQPIAFEPGKMQRLGYGCSDNGTSPTLRSEPGDNQLAVAQPIAVDTYNYTTNDHTTQTIRSQSDTEHIGAVLQPIAVDVYNQSIDGQTSATITEAVGGTNTSGPKVMQPIPINTMTMLGRPSDDKNPRMGLGIGNPGEPQNTLTKTHSHAVATGMAIRRLTPKECERLQGFPDDWTKIPYRNKEADQCPDGPRYKACGNSMAVPVMRWIGQRIQLIEKMMNK